LKSRLTTTFLIIAIITLLSVYYFMGMDYLKQRQGNEELTAQINEAARTLARTPQPAQDLEQRLAAAEASLAAAQGAFPTGLNSTQIINTILKLADSYQVKAIPLTTQPWVLENTGEGYYVFRINMAVRGDFSRLTSFINRLENGELTTLVVENLSITRAGQPTGEVTIPVIANLDVAIYTRTPIPE